MVRCRGDVLASDLLVAGLQCDMGPQPIRAAESCELLALFLFRKLMQSAYEADGREVHQQRDRRSCERPHRRRSWLRGRRRKADRMAQRWRCHGNLVGQLLRRWHSDPRARGQLLLMVGLRDLLPGRCLGGIAATPTSLIIRVGCGEVMSEPQTGHYG